MNENCRFFQENKCRSHYNLYVIVYYSMHICRAFLFFCHNSTLHTCVYKFGMKKRENPLLSSTCPICCCQHILVLYVLLQGEDLQAGVIDKNINEGKIKHKFYLYFTHRHTYIYMLP